MGGRRVLLARIVGVYGVRGAVKLESFTAPRSAVFDYRPWLLECGPEHFEEVVGARACGAANRVVAKLPGVTGRDAARRWIGARIWVPRDALPQPQPDEVYQVDLEGLRVVNLAGDELGLVDHLFDNGAHDVLVARDARGRDRLIPHVPGRYVKSIDLVAGVVVVDWDGDD